MASSIIAKTATSTGSLLGGRTRLKSFVIRSAGSGSPAAVFRSGGGSGTTVLAIPFVAGAERQITLAEHVIIFEDGCHVTLTAVDSITACFG